MNMINTGKALRIAMAIKEVTVPEMAKRLNKKEDAIRKQLRRISASTATIDRWADALEMDSFDLINLAKG